MSGTGWRRSSRRISKRREDAARGAGLTGYDFRWSGNNLVAEVPVYADGTAARAESIYWLYEPGALTPGARYENGQLHYVVRDHMGTPRELLSESGEVVRAQKLSVWGRAERYRFNGAGADEDEHGPGCPWRFAGQYGDEESGLHYNRFRYYDAESGQYLSPDPIGLAGGINPYSYVPNPLKYIDPLGLCKVENARARQAQMLQDGVGYNISPKSWDQYPAIGRDGTFVTDKAGALKYFNGIENGEVAISKSLASTIEKDMGLYPGSLSDGFNIRRIDGISNMQPRSPLSGNDYFLGPGQHLPGGAPEMVINSVPTSTPITIRVNVN